MQNLSMSVPTRVARIVATKMPSGLSLRNIKTLFVFPYCISYRNTGGSLGHQEIEVGTRARMASVSTPF